MAKKTTYSRSGSQAARKKPKSFELVRPVSNDAALETANESDAELENAELVDEVEGAEEAESKIQPVEVVKNAPVAAAASVSTTKSASERMAARRQAAQKEKRSASSLILAENYSYVRKDLVFILILALIMFSAIIIMHFIPAIGG